MCVALANAAKRVALAIEDHEDREFLADCLTELLEGHVPPTTKRFASTANGWTYVSFIAAGYIVPWSELNDTQLANYNRQYGKACKHGILVGDLINPFEWPGMPPGGLIGIA
jgi:hypothetical protein